MGIYGKARHTSCLGGGPRYMERATFAMHSTSISAQMLPNLSRFRHENNRIPQVGRIRCTCLWWCLLDVACPVQVSEAGVSICLQHAVEILEVLLRMNAFTVG